MMSTRTKVLYVVMGYLVTISSATLTKYRGGTLRWIYQSSDDAMKLEIMSIHPGTEPVTKTPNNELEDPSYPIFFHNGTSMGIEKNPYKYIQVSYANVSGHEAWVSARSRPYLIPVSNLNSSSYGFNIQQSSEVWPFVNSPPSEINLFGKISFVARADNNIQNSSPETFYIVAPFHYFAANCQYTIEIPMYDPDLDFVACRLANSIEEGSGFGTSTGVSIDENCVVSVNTTGLSDGSYPVAIIIEDYLNPNHLSAVALSRVPLQFIFTVSSTQGALCSAKPTIPDAFIVEETKSMCDAPLVKSFIDLLSGIYVEQEMVVVAMDADPIVDFVTAYPAFPSIINLAQNSSFRDLSPLQSGYSYFSATARWKLYNDVVGETSFCFLGVTQSGLSTEQKCIPRILIIGAADALDIGVTSLEITNSTRYFYQFTFTIDAPYFVEDKNVTFDIKDTNGIIIHNLTLATMTSQLNLTTRTLTYSLSKAILLDAATDYGLFYPKGIVVSQSGCRMTKGGSQTFNMDSKIDEITVTPISPPPGSTPPTTLDTFVLQFDNDKLLERVSDNATIFAIKRMTDDVIVYSVDMKTCLLATCTLSGSTLYIQLPVSFDWIDDTQYYVTYEDGMYLQPGDGKRTESLADKSWNFTITFTFSSMKYLTQCEDTDMNIFINKSYIPVVKEVGAQNWTGTEMLDPSCSALDIGYLLKWRTDYTGCGTKVSQDATHLIFENEVIVTNGKTDTATTIHRAVYARHKVVCRKPIKVNATFTNSINITDFNVVKVNQTSLGELSIEMQLFPSNQFNTPVTYPAVVAMGDRFNMGLKVEGVANLSIIPQECYATPDDNLLNPIRETFISNRCPIASYNFKVDETSSGTFRYSFDTFRFKNSNNVVYIHCSTVVCLDGIQDAVCQFGCPPTRRRRAVEVDERETKRSLVSEKSGGISEKYILRTGLIILVDKTTNNNNNNHGNSNTSSQSSFFENGPNQILTILFVLVVLTAIFWFIAARYRRKRKLDKQPVSKVNVNMNSVKGDVA